MRASFARTLAELADEDSRILLLTADLGFKALEPFSERHPSRFFNVGVAEQNMIGVATGLAEAGYIPFVYSIVPFAVLRPFEFIRNGPVAHHLPVRIVGVGGGFEYGHNGITHFGMEDVAVLRTQPGLRIICPCDIAQCRAALRSVWDSPGPLYLRLSKRGDLTIPELEGRFQLDRANMIQPGDNPLILGLGTAAAEVRNAGVLLRDRGLNPKVLAISTLNPGPTDDVASHLRLSRLVVTVERHTITGGLGSWVAEILSDKGIPARLLRIGVDAAPGAESGSESWFDKKYGMDAQSIADKTFNFATRNG